MIDKSALFLLKKLDIRKLSLSLHSDWMIVQWYGLMGEWLSQWSAKPFTAVRIRFRPPLNAVIFDSVFFVLAMCGAWRRSYDLMVNV